MNTSPQRTTAIICICLGSLLAWAAITRYTGQSRPHAATATATASAAAIKAAPAAVAAQQFVLNNATVTSLALSEPSIQPGQSVTLTAEVKTQQAVINTPTFLGSISFYDGDALLGTIALQANSASLTLNNLATRTHSFTAVFSGDAKYTGSTSPVNFLRVIGNQPNGDVATAYPADAQSGGQRAGSVLIYNLYSSKSATPAEETEIDLINTHPTQPAAVRLYFVNGATGGVASTFLCLAANQSASFLASQFDPDATGYVIAVAVDRATGAPTSFNYLMGEESVKLAAGQAATLGAEAVGALFSGDLPGWTAGDLTANLKFDGVAYGRLPQLLALDQMPAPGNGSLTSVVVNRLGGDLGTGFKSLGAVKGLLFNQGGIGFDFGFSAGGAQSIQTVPDAAGLTAAERNSFFVGQQPASLRLYPTAAANHALTGAVLYLKEAAAFTGGRNLHQLALAPATTLSVPVTPPTACTNVLTPATDLAVAIKASAAQITAGQNLTYTVTVGNAGPATASGVKLSLTLPAGTAPVALPPACLSDGGNLTCAVNSGSLKPGEQATVEVTIKAAALHTNQLTAAAIATSATTELAPGNNTAFVSTPLTKLVSSAFLASSANPATLGQPVTFTASVTPTAATGSVTFFSGNTPLGSGTVAGGRASFTTASLPVGLTQVSAAYSGDGNYRGVQSATLLQLVSPPAGGGTVITPDSNVTVTFTSVGALGTTTATAVAPQSAGTLPSGYALGGLSVAYDIVTTASYSGSIVVTMKVTSVNDPVAFSQLRILHGEGGALVDRTILAPDQPAPDFASRTLSARVSSLSPFVVAFAPPVSASAQMLSDQKVGSVLSYNFYTSDAGGLASENTQFSLTNTSATENAYVHLFFVDGATCTAADTFVCLTRNQTISFLASDYDPGVSGYVLAVAVDAQTGCPVEFNHLIGDEQVKTSAGFQANLPAEAFAAIPGAPQTCLLDGNTATLRFDGLSYSRAARVAAVDSLPSLTDGNAALLVLNRFGGDLSGSADPLGTLSGLLYDDVERGFSFTAPGGKCQIRRELSDLFPRTSPRLSAVLPRGRTGWLRFAQTEDAALTGAVIIKSGGGLGLGSYSQGHTLHALSRTASATITIPVFPPPPCN